MKDFSALIGQMTVPEKLAQMTQLMGNCFVTEGFGKLMGISYGFDIPEELAWNIGSVLAMSGARKLREVQKSYLEHNRNKIPLLFMHDVIHGFRTIFPVPLAMACSFDPKLAEQAASIAAKEAAVSGLHVTFSPMADLVRDCRWGRVIESSGEDPLLDCMMTQAAVRGYQGDDVGQPYCLAACLKHFAGYGAAEGGRDYNTTEISTYQLENFYLPAYRAAVDAGCKLVMSAFNALNGVPCTANRALFRDLLREKWGFKGTVITDCTALYELVPHGYAADEADAAQRALEAGMDIEMASTAFYKKLPALIAEGKVSASLLDEALRLFPGAREWTVEAGRPDTIDKDKLRVLKEHGIERISVNPQTFSDETLRVIGRAHTAQQTINAFNLAREMGIHHINMDLIAALPGETEADFARSLEKTIALNPESVTVHTLAIKRSSRLHEENRYRADADAAARMVTYARETLGGALYRPYYLYRQKYMAGNLENVGYARSGYACLYNIDNMEETTRILALGAGAITKWLFPRERRIERAPNVRNIEQYIDRAEEMADRKRTLIMS